MRKNGLCLLLLPMVLVSPIAGAGEFSAAVTAAPGETTTLNISFAGDGVTVETEVSLNFSNTFVAISNPVAVNDSICLRVNPTRLRIIPPSGGNTPLPTAATTYCRFTVTVSADAPQGLIALTPAEVLCFNVDANAEPCSLAAGAGITVAGEPLPPPLPTVSFQPSPGTLLTFAEGQVPSTPAPPLTITVIGTGGQGLASLSACSITGSGADRFSVSPSSLSIGASTTQSVSVGCNYPSADALATLTCIEIDANSPAPGVARSFNLRCPAAPPPPRNPIISSVPASGSTFSTSSGAFGALGTATISLFASGANAGGVTTISCFGSGEAQLAALPGTPAGLGPVTQTVVGTAQPTSIRVGVILSGAAQTPAGTITCAVSGQPSLSFTINAPQFGGIGPIISPPPPSGGPPPGPLPIPTLSQAWLLALVSLFGLVGLLVRRPGG